MSIFESVISIFAPHNCINCGLEGTLLCDKCWTKLGKLQDEKCFRCKKPSPNFETCKSCRKISCLDHVYFRSEYKDIPKVLIGLLKFQRAKQASITIAKSLLEILPFSEKYILVAVPTATTRKRQRGYDQSVLITKNLVKESRLPYRKLLVRLGQSQQVGTKKLIRQKQMVSAFRAVNSDQIKDSHILLIDDVITTGSTLESAARLLKISGAKSVDALVFAKVD